MVNLDRFKADFEKLRAEGINLHNAMRVEQLHDVVEDHFVNVLKMDFEAFKTTLPVFSNAYQPWYSKSQDLIKLLLPGRLSDFIAHYEPPKNRKQITKESYLVKDYLNDIKILGFEDKVLVGPVHAIGQFEQQLSILNSVKTRFESSLIDIAQQIRADFLDAELDEAEILLNNKCLRAAGVICSVVLKKHLAQVSSNHQLKIGKKNPQISFYNDLLKKYEVYDFAVWRFIQSLEGIQNLCYQAKKREPTPDEIKDLIIGVDKVIKTIF